MNVEIVPISSLTPDPLNARKHNKRNLDAIKASLSKFGQRKPIVVTHEGTVIAGNGTLEAAISLGWDDISIARSPEDWDENTVRAYALADNQTGALAEWEDEILNTALEDLTSEGWDINELGFDQDFKSEEPKPNDNDNSLQEVPEIPTTRLGDMWIIGLHRIICGDSSDKGTLDRLTDGYNIGCVLTDPPYGIALDTDYTKMNKGGGNPDDAWYGKTSNSHRIVANDDVPFDASFIYNYFINVKEQFWFGANYYRRTIPDDDLSGSWLVWDKRTETSDTGFGSGFELCWSRTKHKQDLLRYLHFGLFSVEPGKRLHPTQKPVAMLTEIVTRWTKEGSIIVDPFAGSGATLVSAARNGRIGLGVELDAAYVDVIVKRLEKETGLTAELELKN